MSSNATERIQQLLFAAADRLEQDSAAAVVPSVPLAHAVSTTKHQPYITSQGPIAKLDKTRLGKASTVVLSGMSGLSSEKSKANTAGPMWFDLPATVQTPELTRDLKLLANRNVLDPHRHYKKEGRRPTIPQFSQVGTVVEGPTDFFTGRLSHKERKQTLAEDLMAGEKTAGKFKSKFQQLQQAKASGRSRHKNLKSRYRR